MVRKIESVFIKSVNVKSYVIEFGCRSSDEFIKELDKKVQLMINQAYDRAKGNGRNTLLKRDL